MLVLQSLLFGVLTFAAVLYASFLWNRRRLYYLAAKLPGPKGFPLIGVAHKMMKTDFKQIFDFVVTVSNDYESPMKIWLGPELVIFADTPEMLQVVLNSQKCLNKSPLYDVVMLTKGLVLSGGDLWKAHRKILNPTFSLGILQTLIPTFDEKSKILLQNLKTEVGKKAFDVYSYVSACGLETLLKATMEIDRDIQSDKNNEYLHNADIAAGVFMAKMFNIFYHIKPIHIFTKNYRLQQKHIVNGVFKIADEVMNEKLCLQYKRSEEEKAFADDDDGYTKKSRSFIGALMDPTNKLTEQEIKDEINTFIAAGHETSALVISNAILMLAIHPEMQEKAIQELRDVYGTAEAIIDYNSLNKLVYLDMIVKETMRLFPVVPIAARKSSEEFEIGDKIIPAGATIVISAFAVQRNKLYWGEDADKFRPERFEPENFRKVHPYAFIPFTGGPRICIGWRYGMLFVKSVLVNFLRQYKASTHLTFEELDYEITLSMKIVQKCMVTIQERDFDC